MEQNIINTYWLKQIEKHFIYLIISTSVIFWILIAEQI